MIRPDQSSSSDSTPPLAVATPPSRKSGRITLKDVAKVAGVHFTTVSMALRDHTSIPESTRVQIKAIAQRLGYTPNPVFSALTHFHLHGRVRAKPPEIAYVINVSRASGEVRYPFEKCILDGAEQQAQRLGYQLRCLSIARGLHTNEEATRILEENQIRGVIIGCFEPFQPALELAWDDYAVVKVNSLHALPETTMVANDQRQDVRLGFQSLQGKGYRRIGLAIGRGDEEATEFRHSTGFLLEQATIPASDRIPQLLFPHRATYDEVVALLREWITAHRVEAVLCNWMNVADLIRDAGFSVPHEVACACLCLVDEPRYKDTAGVCPNLNLVGANAVSLLVTQLKAGEYGVPEFASRTYVRSFWKDGATAPTLR